MENNEGIQQIIEKVKLKITQLTPFLKTGDIIELEARIGHIRDLQSDNRLFLPTDFPVVFNTNKMYVFGPGVTSYDYSFFINEIKKLANADEHKQDGVPTFNVSKKTDTTFSGRSSRYTLVNKKMSEHVRKTKHLIFDIHLPASAYDIRISVCTEENLPLIDAINEKTFKRERERISYKSSDGVSYDFTHIKSYNLRESLEVEMEIVDFDEKLEKIDIFVKKMFDFLCKRKIM
ncbi:mRNA-capping enzyme subunit beta [Cucumispora dikerogammari]|nr:mRNA-capping enzyme subunit beta [Cucumispora dikerogammari]